MFSIYLLSNLDTAFVSQELFRLWKTLLSLTKGTCRCLNLKFALIVVFSLTDVPSVGVSDMTDCFSKLLDEVDEYDLIHDLTIEVPYLYSVTFILQRIPAWQFTVSG